MYEIERKFLVDSKKWNALEKPMPLIIKQGYISTDVEKTVRVRTKNKHAFLTIKGKTERVSRTEFEYEIPLNEAEVLLSDFCSQVLHKNRYEIIYAEKLWEIDVFEGKLAPLILAEIELNSENELFDLPPWVTREVSHDVNYYNSNLIKQLV